MERYKNFTISIRSVSVINDAGQMKEENYRDACVLLFICSGTLTFHCKQNTYIGQPGDVVLYNSNDFNVFYMQNDKFFSAYLIILTEINSSYFVRSDFNFKDIMPFIKSNENEEYIRALNANATFLYNEFMHKSYGYTDIAQNYLEIILTLLFRYYYSSPDSSWGEIKKGKDACQSIREYIDQNYWRDINFESLAGEFYISYNYLSRSFKKRTGYSPVNYLTKIRIGMAKILLVSTDLGIHDIAVDIGYESGSYFSMVFRKQVGVSPTEFRLASKRQI